MTTLIVLALVGLSVWYLWPRSKSKCQTCQFSKNCDHKAIL